MSWTKLCPCNKCPPFSRTLSFLYQVSDKERKLYYMWKIRAEPPMRVKTVFPLPPPSVVPSHSGGLLPRTQAPALPFSLWGRSQFYSNIKTTYFYRKASPSCQHKSCVSVGVLTTEELSDRIKHKFYCMWKTWTVYNTDPCFAFFPSRNISAIQVLPTERKHTRLKKTPPTTPKNLTPTHLQCLSPCQACLPWLTATVLTK